MARLSAADVRWIEHAIRQAEQSGHDQWKVGAVLVRGGAFLAGGCNRYRNDPSVVGADGVSYHAEAVAIRKAGDVQGATLYVARLTRGGALGLSMPCHRCQSLIEETGIRTVVWTTENGIVKRKPMLGTAQST